MTINVLVMVRPFARLIGAMSATAEVKGFVADTLYEEGICRCCNLFCGIYERIIYALFHPLIRFFFLVIVFYLRV